jgi:hypothetical protein
VQLNSFYISLNYNTREEEKEEEEEEEVGLSEFLLLLFR